MPVTEVNGWTVEESTLKEMTCWAFYAEDRVPNDAVIIKVTPPQDPRRDSDPTFLAGNKDRLFMISSVGTIHEYIEGEWDGQAATFEDYQEMTGQVVLFYETISKNKGSVRSTYQNELFAALAVAARNIIICISGESAAEAVDFEVSFTR